MSETGLGKRCFCCRLCIHGTTPAHSGRAELQHCKANAHERCSWKQPATCLLEQDESLASAIIAQARRVHHLRSGLLAACRPHLPSTPHLQHLRHQRARSSCTAFNKVTECGEHRKVVVGNGEHARYLTVRAGVLEGKQLKRGSSPRHALELYRLTLRQVCHHVRKYLPGRQAYRVTHPVTAEQASIAGAIGKA